MSKGNKDKLVIFISGASSGLGAELARLFSKEHYTVALCARNIEKIEALGLQNVHCFKADVSDFHSIQKAITETENNIGPIDCMINNAGFGKHGVFTDITHEDHAQTIDINFKGTVNCIETILPYMQARKRGTIINVGSLADRLPRPDLAVYAASKAAIKSLSDSLRMANAKFGIRVCHVAPAKIKTPMLIDSNLCDEHLIQVEEMAKMILWIYQQPHHICIRDIVIAPTYYEA